MRKHIIALTFLSCLFSTSLYAQEITPQKKVSEKTIDAVVEMFAFSICHNFTHQPAEIIYDCYDKTDKNSQKISQCILADTYIQFGMTNLRKKLKALGDRDYTQYSPFLEPAQYQERFAEKIKAPQFDFLKTPEEQQSYFKSNLSEIEDKINAKCKTGNI